MNKGEEIAILTYFLELTECLKYRNFLEKEDMLRKKYMSKKKEGAQIDEKSTDFFWKCHDFANIYKDNDFFFLDDSRVCIAGYKFHEFCVRNGINFDFDAMLFGVRSIVGEHVQREVGGVGEWGISLSHSEFFSLIRFYISEFFAHQRDGGRILDYIFGEDATRSQKNEQKEHFVRSETNDSSKNELKIEDFVDNSSTDEQKNSFDTKKRDPKWSKAVLQRDHYKCQCCGYSEKKKNLEAHHIYSYRDHEEYRGRLDNGITLCKFCHKKYHSIYGRDDANPYDLALFFKEYSVSH